MEPQCANQPEAEPEIQHQFSEIQPPQNNPSSIMAKHSTHTPPEWLMEKMVEGMKLLQEKIEKLDNKMDRLETRMDRVESRMDKFETLVQIERPFSFAILWIQTTFKETK